MRARGRNPERRTRGVLAPRRALGGWLVVIVALVASTVAVRATGGTPSVLVHAYYLPIIYAAARYGRRAGATAGLVAGLAAGPLMPLESTGGAQPLTEWGLRLAFFVAVGVVSAWLARQQPRNLNSILDDAVLGQRLRSAVHRHQIALHFQPIVDLEHGRVVGVESLCRWQDRPGHHIPPARFISAAERTGAIHPLGRSVVRLACAQTALWSESRWLDADDAAVFVTVNISAAQLTDPAFSTTLTAELERAGVPAERLCLEITETAILDDPQQAIAAVREAHERGHLIALDDFGTGESSLAYLSTFPIDIVKIDRSFVEAVDTDPTVSTLVLAIIEMARALGATTIAEGIERPSQLISLRALGCTWAQGYHLGRPVPADDVDWSARDVAYQGAPTPRTAPSTPDGRA